MLIVTKTYQILTEESAQHGDFEEQGFVWEDQEMTLEEVLDEIEYGGFCDWSSYPIPVNGSDWISTVDPEIDYSSGAQTYYGLHIKGATDEEWDAIVKATEY